MNTLRPLSLIALIFAVSAAPARAQTAYTLADCFRLAAARSDALAGDVELLRQAEESIRQVRANFLPTATFGLTYLRQQTPPEALGQNLFPSSQQTEQFTVTQSLFKGFQDLSTLRQRKSLKRASAEAWRQAYLQLYQDTAQAYYAVLEDEHDVRNYDRELGADRNRLEQLAGMRKFGRAREADVVSIQAAVASVEASAASAGGTLGADRETLAFLTGLEPDIALIDADSSTATIALSKPESDWLARIDERPDLREARRNWDAADHAVTYAQGGHLPTASVTTDYYPNRPGVYNGVHWDAELNVSVPIFSGGLTQSQVRNAVSVRSGEQIAYDLSRRQAVESVQALYKTVDHEIEQAAKLADAARLYDRYYQLLLKDNQSGIATNVDVLLALATSEQTRRQSDRASLSERYDYVRLRISSANAEILNEIAQVNHGAFNDE